MKAKQWPNGKFRVSFSLTTAVGRDWLVDFLVAYCSDRTDGVLENWPKTKKEFEKRARSELREWGVMTAYHRAADNRGSVAHHSHLKKELDTVERKAGITINRWYPEMAPGKED